MIGMSVYDRRKILKDRVNERMMDTHSGDEHMELMQKKQELKRYRLKM